jgi:hypothetical protein
MWRWNPRGERSFARAGLGADDVLMNALGPRTLLLFQSGCGGLRRAPRCVRFAYPLTDRCRVDSLPSCSWLVASTAGEIFGLMHTAPELSASPPLQAVLQPT